MASESLSPVGGNDARKVYGVCWRRVELNCEIRGELYMEKAKEGDLIKLKDGRLVFVIADGEGFQNVGVYYKDFVKHGDYEIVKENDEQE